MANVRNGNTFHIDTQYSVAADELAKTGLRVAYVIVTSSAAGAQLVLSDAGLATKLDLKVATDEDTVFFDFSANPITFSTSIRPTTVTDCTATVVFVETKG